MSTGKTEGGIDTNNTVGSSESGSYVEAEEDADGSSHDSSNSELMGIVDLCDGAIEKMAKDGVDSEWCVTDVAIRVGGARITIHQRPQD